MPQTESHKALVAKIRKARSSGRTMPHLVWAFLRDETNPKANAVPIVVSIAIRKNGTWSPMGGREVPNGPSVGITASAATSAFMFTCTVSSPTARTSSRTTASCASWPRRRRRRSA